MLVVRASLRPSGIHGLGCFTDEPIAQGQVTWVFDARVDVRIAADELATMPEPFQAYCDLYGYAEIVDGRRVITVCGDHSKHMNHSLRPNILSQGENDVAARAIAAGEELTCNYYDFDLDAGEKLTALGAPV